MTKFNPTVYMRGWRAANKDRVKESNARHYDNNIAYYLYTNTKRRCQKEEIAFNLEPSDIVVPSICPILGVKLIPRTRYAPSIDRIYPDRGYTKGNIQIISHKANIMKSDATPEELNKFAEWIKNNSEFVFNREPT